MSFGLSFAWDSFGGWSTGKSIFQLKPCPPPRKINPVSKPILAGQRFLDGPAEASGRDLG
jgi:hypothetical protein